MQREKLSTSLSIITEADEQDINLLRQAARNDFMEALDRAEFDRDQFVGGADKWWPNTIGAQEDYK